jgi:hypothetical protein
MSQQELLKRVVTFLDDQRVDYMITGSYATSLMGAPRATHDLDVVVVLSRSNVDAMLHAFPPPSFYLSERAMREALEQKRMFNLLETESGDKVDFWMLTDEPFDASRFSRKRTVEFQGLRVKVPTPEDTILAKLQRTLACGESEKHFTDALHVYELQRERLDFDYLDEWSKRLDVTELWKRVKAEAVPCAVNFPRLD